MTKTAEIKQQFRPTIEIVRVNGEAVYVAEMSAADAMSLSSGQDLAFRLLAKVIVDKDGRRVYGDEEADLAAIKGMGARAFRKLSTAAFRLNGMMDDEPEKNSDAGPSAG